MLWKWALVIVSALIVYRSAKNLIRTSKHTSELKKYPKNKSKNTDIDWQAEDIEYEEINNTSNKRK